MNSLITRKSLTVIPHIHHKKKIQRRRQDVCGALNKGYFCRPFFELETRYLIRPQSGRSTANNRRSFTVMKLIDAHSRKTFPRIYDANGHN